ADRRAVYDPTAVGVFVRRQRGAERPAAGQTLAGVADNEDWLAALTFAGGMALFFSQRREGAMGTQRKNRFFASSLRLGGFARGIHSHGLKVSLYLAAI